VGLAGRRVLRADDRPDDEGQPTGRQEEAGAVQALALASTPRG
jgi:hypothetical protein